MDFSAEDLFDTIDRIVMTTLNRVGITAGPVDALRVAMDGFDLRVEYVEAEDPHSRKYGDAPRRRPPPDLIVLRDDMTIESQHLLAARAVGRQLLPAVLAKLGVHPEADNRQANTQLVNLIATRLLLPTRWFSADASRAGYDFLLLKEANPFVRYETIANRVLDLDEPCLITVVDEDGTMPIRRSNRFQAPKKLTEAEQECRAQILKTGEPARAKGSGWYVRGWPTPGVPFRRIVMRSIPEDV